MRRPKKSIHIWADFMPFTNKLSQKQKVKPCAPLLNLFVLKANNLSYEKNEPEIGDIKSGLLNLTCF